jgi:hypothetical protein
MNKVLEVQKWLRACGNVDCYTPATFHLERLKAKFAIDYKFHSKYPNLCLLKYSQIDSPFSEPIVQECRGLILNSADNWNAIAFPFTKFFNNFEGLAANIDWKTAKVQEKRDGSLISMWHYKGEWNISTSGCPDGLNQVGDTGITFGELFWQTFNKQNLDTGGLFDWYTYIFELTSPFNRVVVDYKESKLTLIGVGNLQTLNEVHPDKVFFKFAETPRPVEYPLPSVESCLNAANKLNPLENEGYVVVDANFNRVKIKSPAYVAIHHMKDACSLSKLAEVVRNGEWEEFTIAIDSYPEIKGKFLELVDRYKALIEDCNSIYSSIKDIENQKEFALKACKTPYSGVLFAMRKTGKSPQAIIKEMLTNAYLKLIGIK